MCAFKYCKGPEACFLRDISPCPGAWNSQPPANVDTAEHDRGARNRGFVDRDGLAKALGLDGEADPLRARIRHLRVTSKLERAMQMMGQRRAS